jgi:hypothetical protein
MRAWTHYGMGVPILHPVLRSLPNCHAMALPPFSDGIILWQANTIYCYDLATSELRILCESRRMTAWGTSGHASGKTSSTSMSSPSRKVIFGLLNSRSIMRISSLCCKYLLLHIIYFHAFWTIWYVQRLCLDPLKNALCKKKRFFVTSNLRYMYGVLNVDKIKN